MSVTHSSKSGFRPPHRASGIGMWLFLTALGMLFGSSMLLYVMMRLHYFGKSLDLAIRLPPEAWGSTGVLIAASFTIHQAVAGIRIERLKVCLKYLYITAGLAVLFLVIQSPCMWTLLQTHRAIAGKIIAAKIPGQISPVPLYGLVFVLILLHAMHVLGGIVALGIVTYRARNGAYDHEDYMGVQFAARYWHFLDVVWLVMFTTFLVLP